MLIKKTPVFSEVQGLNQSISTKMLQEIHTSHLHLRDLICKYTAFVFPFVKLLYAISGKVLAITMCKVSISHILEWVLENVIKNKIFILKKAVSLNFKNYYIFFLLRLLLQMLPILWKCLFKYRQCIYKGNKYLLWYLFFNRTG